jgi:aspartate carbamoyltransferase catalytic subunit
VKHLLGIDDLGADGIGEVLRLADSFLEVTRRDIPKVPALRGKTVVSMFYEDSTRTRLSFETAAKRLSADTMTFSAGSSSLRKGESLLDTVRTVEAMGIDAIVVRHRSSGVPQRIAGWIDASVVNAGDGWHEHPTQALLDAFTLRRRRGPSFAGMRVAIVGDIKHSRVARSNVKALSALGAEITLVGPPTLMPPDLLGARGAPVLPAGPGSLHPEGWPVAVRYDLDEVLPTTDVLYVLRIQRERQSEALFPSLREYASRYGVTSERLARLPADALVMHPGPTNRGVEITADAADDPRSVINEQVSNGVAVRMAVLYQLLGSGGQVALGGAA